MSSDHTFCASSPRGSGGGGLCKALKEMKSKVASHTGMSLSFVELVATSPMVSLLPALPPSPRSPSALLHRHLHLHSNYIFVARRSSSTEQSTCVEMENMGTCTDVETEGTQSTRAIAAEDGDSRPGIKPSMLCDVSYGCCPSICQVCHMSCENPSSCNLSCGHPLSSSPACSSTCGHQSSSSSSCNLSCGHPLSSSPACSLTCGHQSSSSSSCNLSCEQPSSCVLLCRDPSSLSMSSLSMSCCCHVSCGHRPSYSSCNLHPSSSLSCDSSCGHSSSSSSCDLSCGHFSSSSSCVLTCVQHQSSSSSSLSPSSLRSSCDLSNGQPSSSSNHSCVVAKIADMNTLPTDELSSNNVDCCNTFRTSSTGMCKHATTMLQVASASARVLYFIVTLIFALSSITKSFYKSCLWGGNISRRVLHPHTLMHYIRVMLSGTSLETKSEDGYHGNEMEGIYVSVGQQSSQGLKTRCMKRSKLLKSKLRSSFKSLSVQVPRKAFAPLHFNTFPHSSASSSSSSTSTLSSSSPSSSKSPAVNGSPSARKTRTLRSPAFARKLTKSFNQRQPCTVSQISPVSPAIHMQSLPTSYMVCSHQSSCEFNQHGPNSSTSLNKLGDSVVAPIVTVPLALCALFYGKLIAFITVTAWLLIVSIARSVYFPWKTTPSQICSPS